VQVRASEEVAIAYSLTAAGAAPAPPRRPLDGVRAPLSEGHVLTSDREPVYAPAHRFKLSGLLSNTTYTLDLRATTRTGQPVDVQQTFTTLKQRVRVTLREITITEDGDAWWMDGEPVWVVKLNWSGGSVAECYPIAEIACQPGSFGEGRIFPRHNDGQFLAWTFAEENFDTMPAEFRIYAVAKEYDVIPGVANVAQFFEDCFADPPTGGCSFSSPLPAPPWQAPQGVEWASTTVRVAAHDSGTGFESVLTVTFELFHDGTSYPSRRNAPSSTWR
jgi:hypothetical protein